MKVKVMCLLFCMQQNTMCNVFIKKIKRKKRKKKKKRKRKKEKEKMKMQEARWVLQRIQIFLNEIIKSYC